MLKRILIPSLCCFVLFVSAATVFPQAQPLSPTETARFFYKSMHDKKFKEAFALTIYKPAIDGLSSKEFEDLRPDFERMAKKMRKLVNKVSCMREGTLIFK